MKKKEITEARLEILMEFVRGKRFLCEIHNKNTKASNQHMICNLLDDGYIVKLPALDCDGRFRPYSVNPIKMKEVVVSLNKQIVFLREKIREIERCRQVDEGVR